MIYRLKKNFEFTIVYKRGKSFANELLVMYILKIEGIRIEIF